MCCVSLIVTYMYMYMCMHIIRSIWCEAQCACVFLAYVYLLYLHSAAALPDRGTSECRAGSECGGCEHGMPQLYLVDVHHGTKHLQWSALYIESYMYMIPRNRQRKKHIKGRKTVDGIRNCLLQSSNLALYQLSYILTYKCIYTCNSLVH